MDVTQLAEEIESRLLALSDRRTATVRNLRRHYTRQLKSAAPDDMVQLALRLVNGPDFIWRFVAYELLAHHRAALASLRQRKL